MREFAFSMNSQETHSLDVSDNREQVLFCSRLLSAYLFTAEGSPLGSKHVKEPGMKRYYLGRILHVMDYVSQQLLNKLNRA